jgi:hypothetical protein
VLAGLAAATIAVQSPDTRPPVVAAAPAR